MKLIFYSTTNNWCIGKSMKPNKMPKKHLSNLPRYCFFICRIKQWFQRLMYDIDKNTSVRYPKKLSAVKLSCSRKIEVKWNQHNSYKVTNPKTKWSIIDSVVQPISCSVEVLYSLITYFRNKNCNVHKARYCIYMYIFGHKKYLLRYVLCTIVFM